MAVKNDSIRVYKLVPRGTKGRKDDQYVRQPSTLPDDSFWAAVSFVSQKESLIGGQAQRTAIYDVTTDTQVPYTMPDCDCYITVMPGETQILRVNSVAELRNTGERQARCMEASDIGVTLTQ